MGLCGIAIKFFSSANLKLICSWFLLANGVCVGVIASVVIYKGVEKNSVDCPIYCSAIISSFCFLLGFRELINIKKNKTMFSAGCC